MKDKFKEWPFFVAMVLYFLGIETIVIPFILKGGMGFSGLTLYFAAMTWATGEFCYWIWFSKWVSPRIRKLSLFQEIIDYIKKIMPKIIEAELIEITLEWLRRTFIKRFDPPTYESDKTLSGKAYFILTYLLKSKGYLLGYLFIFGIAIIPVIWIGGVVFCRKRGWNKGFFTMWLGVLIKTTVVVYSWDYIWSFFS